MFEKDKMKYFTCSEIDMDHVFLLLIINNFGFIHRIWKCILKGPSFKKKRFSGHTCLLNVYIELCLISDKASMGIAQCCLFLKVYSKQEDGLKI
jgi:hypothetical protein